MTGYFLPRVPCTIALSLLPGIVTAHALDMGVQDVACSEYPEWSENSTQLYAQTNPPKQNEAPSIVVWDGAVWARAGRHIGTGEPGQDRHWRYVGECRDDPVATYQPSDSQPGIDVTPGGEYYLPISPERLALHQASHDYTPVITAKIPPFFDPPLMENIEDFVLNKDDLVVINPAPDEFLWIMEGKRHGYEELTVVFTNTPTGNGAPLHTHVGEEAHVLLQGEMRYFLNGEEFVVQAPYIVNIPSMMPHAFMNVDSKPAQLVGIFPASNEWEYDVLDASVFAPEADPLGFPGIAAQGNDHFSMLSEWHNQVNRQRRIEKFREAYGRED